ncbi:MAG: cytochrome C oxidase subunit IV family protein [Actinomycetia bacterium]|nr:cytochrome C oxidase subunit IV family protein [Actinomycetes bacterium]
MADTITEADVEREVHDEHPTNGGYVKIALFLAVLTGLEVLTYPLADNLNNSVLITSLLIMMTIKFAIVAGYFMHLKFDSKIFSTLFVFGIILALAVYVATLSAFRFFTDGDGKEAPVITQVTSAPPLN